MQVCLDECHRVGTEASNLFPGSGASRPATTGALWPGPGSLWVAPEGLGLEVDEKVQVRWGVQVEVEM